jgi:hypothetical protein
MHQSAGKDDADDNSMWVTDDDDDLEKVNNLSSLYLNKTEMIVFLIELIFLCYRLNSLMIGIILKNVEMEEKFIC